MRALIVTPTRLDAIRERLQVSLHPELLDIADESHLHAGHAGARDGRGHFRVTIVSRAFAGQTRLHRHRLVYEALGPMMQTDIHALTIQAIAPAEL
jgi:BolA family transcriptional regulator, general stress-responsive regulator